MIPIFGNRGLFGSKKYMSVRRNPAAAIITENKITNYRLPPRFRHNRHFDRRLRGFNGRYFQRGHEPFPLFVFAVCVAPAAKEAGQISERNREKNDLTYQEAH